MIAHDGQTVALALLGPKLAVVLALGALSRYVSGQSGVHLHQAQHLRKVQLELQNLGEFLLKMDPRSAASRGPSCSRGSSMTAEPPAGPRAARSLDVAGMGPGGPQ